MAFNDRVDKFYPVQGTNKFRTVSFPMTDAFRIDSNGLGNSETVGTKSLPKGTMVLGFVARCVEAFETAGSGTVQLGFTGAQMLSSPIGSAASVVGSIIAHSSTAINPTYVLSANDTFDIIIDASGLSTAGKWDVFLTYVPVPINDLSTSEFRQYIATS